MNRTQLQQLARERIHDADALLNAGRWSGAYYLAGYAVECGLKACIARLTNQDDFPDKDRALKSYTHRIDVLVEVAGLGGRLRADAAANPVFSCNCLVVRDWDETARYQQWDETQARKLFAAITDATDGVLSWITSHW